MRSSGSKEINKNRNLILWGVLIIIILLLSVLTLSSNSLFFSPKNEKSEKISYGQLDEKIIQYKTDPNLRSVKVMTGELNSKDVFVIKKTNTFANIHKDQRASNAMSILIRNIKGSNKNFRVVFVMASLNLVFDVSLNAQKVGVCACSGTLTLKPKCVAEIDGTEHECPYAGEVDSNGYCPRGNSGQESYKSGNHCWDCGSEREGKEVSASGGPSKTTQDCKITSGRSIGECNTDSVDSPCKEQALKALSDQLKESCKGLGGNNYALYYPGEGKWKRAEGYNKCE